MAFSKKIIQKLTYIYLILFPFGQISGFIFNIYYPNLPTVHITDILVLLISILALSFHATKIRNLKWFKSAFYTLFILIFGFLLSILILKIKPTLGALYLVRFASYLIFSAVLFLVFKLKKQKVFLFNSLIVVSIFIAIFGIIQYLWIPDLRSLKLLQWDDHYFRLVGTFFDPTFTGILLVFGYLIAFIKFLKTKNYNLIFVILMLLAALFLTYSRSSFLSFFTANLYIIFSRFKNKSIPVFTVIAVIAVAIVILPKGSGGEGVNIARVNSIILKIENTKEGIDTFVSNPVFGVGFNNLCAVNTANNNISPFSHSCSGFDNSIIFLLASTGIVGSLSLLYFFTKLWSSTSDNIFGLSWKASVVALATHTMFTNTLFYAWVMGWLAILTAISRRK